MELWEFTGAQVVTPPLELVNVATGEVKYQWTLPVRSSVSELYRNSQSGLGIVVHSWPNHGDTDHPFVMFISTRDIYTIDLSSGSLNKRISATSPSPLPVQPALSIDYSSHWSANHETKGYVYVFIPKIDDPTVTKPALVLEDTNRDGAIDQSYTLGPGAILTELGGTDSFIEMYPQ